MRVALGVVERCRLREVMPSVRLRAVCMVRTIRLMRGQVRRVCAIDL
jgi:hypothetical protein